MRMPSSTPLRSLGDSLVEVSALRKSLMTEIRLYLYQIRTGEGCKGKARLSHRHAVCWHPVKVSAYISEPVEQVTIVSQFSHFLGLLHSLDDICLRSHSTKS